MDRKFVASALFLLLVFGVAIIAWAATTLLYEMPMQATVPSPQLSILLDDESWSNGTSVDWGDVIPGESYSKNLTVVNNGIINFTVYVTVANLPLGWTLTWTANNTLVTPDSSAIGNLTLTIADDAESGTYQWKLYIHVED